MRRRRRRRRSDELVRTVKDRVLGSQNLSVSLIAPNESLTKCRVLYISTMTSRQVAPFVAGLRDLPVLTISDLEGFSELGGIATFLLRERTAALQRQPRVRPARPSPHQLEAAGDGHTKMTNPGQLVGRGFTLALVAALAMWSPVSAQTRLPDLSLEDLMKLDAGQVFGASERLQPVMEAPASVTFITAEEIARFGYRTLADILRSVRGMYVTNDRNFSYIGTRGFSKPGDYNSRILLLINGHRVNDNVFGQAEIGAEFGLDPAMFERVEVIRGPPRHSMAIARSLPW